MKRSASSLLSVPNSKLLVVGLVCSSTTTRIASGFTAPCSRSFSSSYQTKRAALTRHHVGGKWQLPSFLTEPTLGDDDHTQKGNKTNNKKKTVVLRDTATKAAVDFEQPTSSFSSSSSNSLLSSFFRQDTVQDQESQHAMGDLVDFMSPTTSAVDQESKPETTTNLVPLFGVLAVALLTVGASVAGIVPTSDISLMVTDFVQDPTSALEHVTDLVASMGPWGPLYFGFLYTLAEVLAIPAVPLTASAGYLFGVSTGTLVVLVSASLAASISFAIGRTLLRTTVERAMTQYPEFAKLDKAIGREGFKLMLLLRLSPIFPFALSNYLYGATSIDFASFFWATLVGFAPGTLAYVYTGVVGKALTLGGDSAQPWYIYAGGAVLLGGLLKVLVDVAGTIVQEMEDEAELDA